MLSARVHVKEIKYQNAQEAFDKSKQGDVFRLTTTNPNSKSHVGGTEGNTMTSTQDLIKMGDFFVPLEDVGKLSKEQTSDRTKIRREYRAKDLDENNRELIISKIGEIKSVEN